jgi:hypothetical protein
MAVALAEKPYRDYQLPVRSPESFHMSHMNFVKESEQNQAKVKIIDRGDLGKKEASQSPSNLYTFGKVLGLAKKHSHSESKFCLIQQ